MQAALKQRQQQMGVVRASMMKEKDEELTLFLEMKKREKDWNDLFLNSSEEFDSSLGTKPETSPIFNIRSSTHVTVQKTGADDFLSSDNDKNDYDCLLTPPGTPLFPSTEMESQKTKTQPVALKSRLANHQSEPAVKSNLSSRQPVSSLWLNSSTGGTRRHSLSKGSGSRPATATGHPTLNTVSKPSRPSMPTSRPILSSPKPTAGTTRAAVCSTKPTVCASRPTTSAAKAAVSASNSPGMTSKTVGAARSTTPLSRTTARSSTPTSKPTLPPSKSISKASTPTRRQSTPSSASSLPPPIKSSSSIYKPTSSTSRNPVPSRAASLTVKSRPWKPSEMPGFSLDAPHNLLTMPERPLSATRGRPGAPTSRSSSVEPAFGARPRRRSCSPSRGRTSNGVSHPSGSSMPSVRYSKVNDNVSPVVMGTKMVERVINMRKLAPPKQDSKLSPPGNLVDKSSSPDSSHLGSTLSRRSLVMAIRHMDIRRTIPGSLRPLMTNIPASSMYSVRSGTQRSRNVKFLRFSSWYKQQC